MTREEDRLHPVARAIRAARAWSGLSRQQLATRLGLKAGATIGRWERGDWRDGPPRPPMLEALADITEAADLAQRVEGLLTDPAMRFAAEADREARPPREHPSPDEEDQADGGAEGGDV